MKKNITKAVAVCAMSITLLTGMNLEASASQNKNLEAGVTAALNANIEKTESELLEENKEPVTVCGYTNLGIANVQNHLNIRESAGEDSELVGILAVNAGCEILEVEGEWTKISSGKVTGYVKSEFLLTGEAAKNKADEVKSIIATTNTQTVYLRTEPNTDCTIWTAVPEHEELHVLEVLGDWIKVELDGDECYVFTEYVTLGEQLDKASTMSEVKYGQGVSDVRVELVQYATQFIGNRYVWGGTDLNNGVDCSGFTMKIYEKYGISIPHFSQSQANCGTRVEPSNALPGDLFFYGNEGGINHVAIYMGNGQVVHASSAKTGIKISNAYYRSPVCVVRLIND